MSLGNIIAIVISVLTGAGIIAWIKLGPELRSLNADLASKYQEIADKAAERIAELEEDIGTMRAEVKLLKSSLESSDREAARVRNWAERLSGQVISLGAVPVPLDPSPTRPRTQE